MKKVIIETNFLMIPFQLKVDIFSEIERIVNHAYETCVIDKTIDELKKILENERGKTKQAAKFALSLIEKKKLKIIKTLDDKKDADDEIISIAKKEDCIVATQDKLLKERLKLLKRKVIILRQKRYLEINY